MFECNLYPIYLFCNCWQSLFPLRGFSLLSSSNDPSVDIADNEGSSEFSPKCQFISTLQQTLK